jgi:hypothetical protein
VNSDTSAQYIVVPLEARNWPTVPRELLAVIEVAFRSTTSTLDVGLIVVVIVVFEPLNVAEPVTSPVNANVGVFDSTKPPTFNTLVVVAPLSVTESRVSVSPVNSDTSAQYAVVPLVARN